MKNTDEIQMLLKVSWYKVFNYTFQSSYHDKQYSYTWLKNDLSLKLLHDPDARSLYNSALIALLKRSVF